MPRWIPVSLIVLATLALLPFACVARSRSMRSALPRVHIVQDMDNQGRFKSQQANPLFADSRAMRAPVVGTVARGHLTLDDHLHRGIQGAGYAEALPLPLDRELLLRGRKQYEISCAPCHGLSGHGDGMVARRADSLLQGTWVPPSSFHEAPASTRPVGHIFNSITNGIRNMPAYGRQIAVQDRWAIVAYVRALQRSQLAGLDDVPESVRATLRQRRPNDAE